MTPQGQAEKPSQGKRPSGRHHPEMPDGFRQGDETQGDNDTSAGGPGTPAARREPRGGEIPMELIAIGRLICPMPEVFWRMTSGESGIRGEIGLRKCRKRKIELVSYVADMISVSTGERTRCIV